jgi:hypothetical protein
VRLAGAACPWLIRRFVDPGAEFLYVPADRVADIATPRQLAPGDLAGAAHVVVMGCDLDPLLRSGPHPTIERWDDVPPVSADLPRAREAILARVTVVVDRLGRGWRSTVNGESSGRSV